MTRRPRAAEPVKTTNAYRCGDSRRTRSMQKRSNFDVRLLWNFAKFYTHYTARSINTKKKTDSEPLNHYRGATLYTLVRSWHREHTLHGELCRFIGTCFVVGDCIFDCVQPALPFRVYRKVSRSVHNRVHRSWARVRDYSFYISTISLPV